LIDRMASKRTVLVLVLASASIALVCGSRVWVSGSVNDVVLGPGALRGVGSDVAPGALAAALVGLASAVVAATSGRVLRIASACSTILAALLGATVVILVVADPGGALGKLAATGTGRSGVLEASGRVEGWAWVALASMLAMGLGGLGALVGGRRWHGLSSAYDAGQRPAAQESPWEQLSRGDDPTAGH